MVKLKNMRKGPEIHPVLQHAKHKKEGSSLFGGLTPHGKLKNVNHKTENEYRIVSPQSKKRQRSEALKNAAEQRKKLDELQMMLENARLKYERGEIGKKSKAAKKVTRKRRDEEVEGFIFF